MDKPLTDTLPDALRSVRTRHLLTLRLAVRGPLPAIAIPGAGRRIGVVTGGEFDGERLAGLSCGLIRDLDELAAQWQVERTFLPTMSREQAGGLMAEWEHAVRQATAR